MTIENNVKVEKTVYYFENKYNFSLPPQKNAWVRAETNIPKNSKAIVVLARRPGRCLLHYKGIGNDQTFFPHRSGKREVCSASITKSSSI